MQAGVNHRGEIKIRPRLASKSAVSAGLRPEDRETARHNRELLIVVGQVVGLLALEARLVMRANDHP